MTFNANDIFIMIIDHLGTFAFALSGIRLASAKRFDLFGAFVIGLVTAIGGGTTRDILLNKTPFWMIQSSYIIITSIALFAAIFFSKQLIKLNTPLFIFDTIGLGLFVVVGINESVNAGFPFWVSIVMGVITGTVGGVVRDVLINEIPLLFRRDIYALACVFGGVSYIVCDSIGISLVITNTISATSVILIRFLAVKYHIQVPTLKNF